MSPPPAPPGSPNSGRLTNEDANSEVGNKTPSEQHQMYSSYAAATKASIYEHQKAAQNPQQQQDNTNMYMFRPTDPRHDAAVHEYYNPPYDSDQFAFTKQLDEIDAQRRMLGRRAAIAAMTLEFSKYEYACDYVPKNKVELFDEPIYIGPADPRSYDNAARNHALLWARQPSPASPMLNNDKYDSMRDSARASSFGNDLVRGVSLLKGNKSLGDPFHDFSSAGHFADDDPFVTPPSGPAYTTDRRRSSSDRGPKSL